MMKEEIKLNLYTVTMHKGDLVQHGLPFVAMSDDLAQKMVLEAMAKHTHAVDLGAFDVVCHGSFYPDRNVPIVKAKSIRTVANVGELFAATGRVVDGGNADE